MHAELAKIPGIQFRSIPDPAGDSHTFLSWFMPNCELTEAVVAELKSQQIFAGNFYWFDHNWHYIRKWDHLKSCKSLNRLSPAQTAALTKLNTQDFSKSDSVMSCCIRTAIGLSWTEDQLNEKASRLAACIKKVMANASPQAYYSQQASLA
jgi:8-amino-3,8-dideoxy-alpha-D-manno-octulosonate transaminase